MGLYSRHKPTHDKGKSGNEKLDMETSFGQRKKNCGLLLIFMSIKTIHCIHGRRLVAE